MKLALIGIGQAGGKVVDALVDYFSGFVDASEVSIV